MCVFKPDRLMFKSNEEIGGLTIGSMVYKPRIISSFTITSGVPYEPLIGLYSHRFVSGGLVNTRPFFSGCPFHERKMIGSRFNLFLI